MDATQKQINQIIGRVQVLQGSLKKVIRSELTNAAKPVLAKVQAAAPVGTRNHHRYRSMPGKRAGRGKGVIKQYLRPGNLKDSLNILNFSRARQAVFVGPSVGRKRKIQRNKGDGYYAQMVAFGTRYMAGNNFLKRGWEASRTEVLNRLSELLARHVATRRWRTNNTSRLPQQTE